jgi:tetratricopeptide (TPR) repeat protein
MSELSITGLLTLGKYSEALSLIDQLLVSDKNNPLLLYQKGFCLYNIKKYKEALESLEKAIEQKKDYRDALIYLAKSELAMRDYLKSSEHYQTAHNLKSLNRKETISYVKALTKLGKNNQALEFIESNNLINLLDIIDIEIQKIKIDLFLKIGKPKEALYIIEKLEPINIQKDITLDIYKADALIINESPRRSYFPYRKNPEKTSTKRICKVSLFKINYRTRKYERSIADSCRCIEIYTKR